MFYISSDPDSTVLFLDEPSYPSNPSTVYTVMRTVRGRWLAEFDYHMERLHSSRGEEILSLIRMISSKIAVFDELVDYKISIYIHPSSGKIEVFVDKILMQNKAAKERIKFISTGPRRDDLPAEKLVNWSTKRMEFSKEESCNDIVMLNGSFLLEGLSSNFGIIKRGKDESLILQTAPTSKVLGGSIMRVIIELCKAEGVEVVLECPSIEDISDWYGCFITSTSRLLQPIKEVILEDDGDGGSIFIMKIPQSPFLLLLQSKLVDCLQERSSHSFFEF